MQAVVHLDCACDCCGPGRFDIILCAHFPTADDLSRFMWEELAKIEGLQDSETFLCLHVEKGGYLQI